MKSSSGKDNKKKERIIKVMYLSWWSVYFPFDPYSFKWYQQKHNSSFGINRVFSFRPVVRLFHCVHPYPYSLKYYHGPLIIVSFFFFYFLLILKNYLLIVVRASKSYKDLWYGFEATKTLWMFPATIYFLGQFIITARLLVKFQKNCFTTIYVVYG